MTLRVSPLVLLAFVSCVESEVEDAHQRPGVLRPAVPNTRVAILEEVVRVPSRHDPMTLEMTVFRPDAPGRHPLVVISHGAIGRRDPSPRWRPQTHVRWYVDRGFVVAVPMRRGNAGSDGDWAEGFGSCADADYVSADRESANDIEDALRHLRSRSFVDPERVLLHGVSAGGMASLALAARRPAGVRAVVSFAGGRGSLTNDGGATRRNCSPAALVEAARRSRGTVPSLWLYAENDAFFPPALARAMFDAFQPGAGAGEHVQLAPFGIDGHSIGWEPDAIPLWEAHVDQLLRRTGLGQTPTTR